MKITAISAFPVQGPWVDLCFVKVETDAGLHGWGEASLPGKSAAVAQAVRDAAIMVIGMDALETERVWQRLYRHSYWRGGPILTSSLSGIDTALWDIKGKAWDKPVHALLGGPVRDRIAAYANIGDSTDPEELRRRVATAIAQGYRAVKFYPLIEHGGTERHDAIDAVVKACAAVRDALGPERGFALDFHGRLSPALAIGIEWAVRDFRPMWIEEPINAENLSGYEKVAAKFVTPLALGERSFTRWGYRDLFERRIADVIQPDVSNAGGISELVRIAAMAELYGVAFAPHNPNGPLQSQTSLHLAAALPAFTTFEYVPEGETLMPAFAKVAPNPLVDGFFALPQGPGLGIEMDEAVIAQHPSAPFNWDLYRADGAIADW